MSPLLFLFLHCNQINRQQQTVNSPSVCGDEQEKGRATTATATAATAAAAAVIVTFGQQVDSVVSLTTYIASAHSTRAKEEEATPIGCTTHHPSTEDRATEQPIPELAWNGESLVPSLSRRHSQCHRHRRPVVVTQPQSASTELACPSCIVAWPSPIVVAVVVVVVIIISNKGENQEVISSSSSSTTTTTTTNNNNNNTTSRETGVPCRLFSLPLFVKQARCLIASSSSSSSSPLPVTLVY